MGGAVNLAAFEPPKLGQPFEDMGITLELVVSNEFVAVTNGGIDRTEHLLMVPADEGGEVADCAFQTLDPGRLRRNSSLGPKTHSRSEPGRILL